MQIYQNIKLNENGLCNDAQDHGGLWFNDANAFILTFKIKSCDIPIKPCHSWQELASPGPWQMAGRRREGWTGLQY